MILFWYAARWLTLKYTTLLTGLEDTAHIYQDKGEICNVVLGLVDVVRGTNSFYKLQALESDRGGW